jgi:hypothetical protein
MNILLASESLSITIHDHLKKKKKKRKGKVAPVLNYLSTLCYGDVYGGVDI